MASNDNKSKLHLGSFDSERFWRAPTLSQLPSVVDAQADAIVAVMDELMFAACHAEGGLLVTRRPMDKTHVDYLRETGFRFSRNEKPVETDETISGNDAICGLLQAAANRAYFSELFSGLGGLSPYSVLPTTQPFCQHYGIAQKIPSIEAVRKANSKLFSHALEIEELGEWHGETIDSAAELEKVGKHLLKNTTILIKDDFGVSGKGNLLVDSPQLLERIARHIGKQEKKWQTNSILAGTIAGQGTGFFLPIGNRPNWRSDDYFRAKNGERRFCFCRHSNGGADVYGRLGQGGLSGQNANCGGGALPGRLFWPRLHRLHAA